MQLQQTKTKPTTTLKLKQTKHQVKQNEQIKQQHNNQTQSKSNN